jgi:hypothetical protein
VDLLLWSVNCCTSIIQFVNEVIIIALFDSIMAIRSAVSPFSGPEDYVTVEGVWTLDLSLKAHNHDVRLKTRYH